MRVKRWVAAAATSVVVAGIGVAGAAPASATGSFTDNGDGTATLTYSFGGFVGVVICDGSVLASECSGLSNRVYQRNTPELGFVALGTSPVTFEQGMAVTDIPSGFIQGVVPLPAGNYTITYWETCTSTFCGTLIASIENVRIGSVSPSSPVAEQPPIPAWVQAYGRDKDATCLDGWDASWQSWAEPVTGGWVCTRSIPSLD